MLRLLFFKKVGVNVCRPGSARDGGLVWVKGESSEVMILLSLCKGVELDLTSLFPLPESFLNSPPGLYPPEPLPFYPYNPNPPPGHLPAYESGEF